MYPCVPLVDRQSSILGKIFATPKSVNFKYPVSDMRMFSGFTSAHETLLARISISNQATNLCAEQKPCGSTEGQ